MVKRYPNEIFPFGARGNGGTDYRSGVGEGVGYAEDVRMGNGGTEFMDYGEDSDDFPWPGAEAPQKDVYEDNSAEGAE